MITPDSLPFWALFLGMALVLGAGLGVCGGIAVRGLQRRTGSGREVALCALVGGLVFLMAGVFAPAGSALATAVVMAVPFLAGALWALFHRPPAS